ncbi:MAG: CvpA family protein [Candidatus Omnitrophica bacterium]|nr:CvpA family protein [Candidatus Omnitrophota bacterium]
MEIQATAWPNWVDLVVVIITLRTSCSGFGRGILAESLYLFGTVGVSALACNFHGIVAQQLAAWIPLRPAVLNVAVFVGLLVLSGILLRALIRRLALYIRVEQLPAWIQRLGLVLGAIRGLWWASVLLWLLIGIGPYFAQSVEQRSLVGDRLLKFGRPAIERAASWFPGYTHTGVLVPVITPPSKR